MRLYCLTRCGESSSSAWYTNRRAAEYELKQTPDVVGDIIQYDVPTRAKELAEWLTTQFGDQ